MFVQPRNYTGSYVVFFSSTEAYKWGFLDEGSPLHLGASIASLDYSLNMYIAPCIHHASDDLSIVDTRSCGAFTKLPKDTIYRGSLRRNGKSIHDQGKDRRLTPLVLFYRSISYFVSFPQRFSSWMEPRRKHFHSSRTCIYTDICFRK